MSENTLHARIVSIHDVESNWNSAKTFIPRAGELVIYDPDHDHHYSRFKIGDGKTLVADLPFSLDIALSEFFEKDSDVIYLNGGSIRDYM